MRVHFEMFRSLGKPWGDLFQEAADFSTRLKPGRLISISHSEDQADAVVSVWYWGEGESVTSDAPSTSRAASKRSGPSKKS